jgi:hypothetical protein
MSYILDALKRSEQERHQEKIASIDSDLMVIPRSNHQKPIWPYLLILCLIINAGVFIYLSLPKSQEQSEDQTEPVVPEYSTMPTGKVVTNYDARESQSQMTKALPEHLRTPVANQKRAINLNDIESRGRQIRTLPDKDVEYTSQGEEIIRPKHGVKRTSPHREAAVLNPQFEEQVDTSDSSMTQAADSAVERIKASDSGKPDNSQDFLGVPLLSEMSIDFQREIPDIHFSSHIFSSEPSARRAMINNLYMREGDGFSGVVLREIGEFYVLLSKEGEEFKIPVLRDWQSP